jgi:hypothetical protein
MSEEIAQALADLAAAQQLWQELKAITAEHARLRAELEVARVVVAAARQWMVQGTSLLPIEKTDWIAVGAIIDAVRAYDAAIVQEAKNE